MAKLKNYNKGMVPAVGGPPHSGKSVFLAELYTQLLARRSANFAFLQRACPDGEGMWSAEAPIAVVRAIRRKGNFDAGFMAFTLGAVEALGTRFPITLVDLGGRRSAQNAEILARSTHLLNLCSVELPGERQPWVEFAAADGCKLLADFRSEMVYRPGMERKPENLDLGPHVRSEVTVAPDATVAGGILRNLDRGLPGDSVERLALIRECYREAVSQFADWLIARADKESAR